jgi:hypothetical protein
MKNNETSLQATCPYDESHGVAGNHPIAPSIQPEDEPWASGQRKRYLASMRGDINE